MDWKILTEYPPEGDSGDKMLAAWEEFLACADLPTHYVTPGFFTDPFIRGGERFAVLAFDGEKIAAVLTGVDAGKAVRSGLAVRPQTVFRKDTDRVSAAKALLDGVLEKGGDDLELLSFHTWQPIEGIKDLEFREERCEGGDAVVMLDLTKGAAALQKDFSQTRRNEIKQAIKKGEVTVKELETEDELDELYAIHVGWNQRKGNEPDSREDFVKVFNDKKNRKTLIAIHQEKVIAGTFFRFSAGGVVEYAGNNSLEEFQKLRPNPLLIWRAIEWAAENNFTHFSMGASHDYLRRFGGDIHCNYRYTFDRTFLQRHVKKAQLKKLLTGTYLMLPVATRRKIKQALGKA